MDYKLAKKLKDAGFPQEPTIELGGGCDGQTEKASFYFASEPETCGYEGLMTAAEVKANLEKGMTVVKLPLLEELIEAVCKINLKADTNFDLEVHMIHDFGYKASMWIRKSIEPPDEQTIFEWSKESPEVAAANLWLELEHQSNCEASGCTWCSKHKVKHQGQCDECRTEAGHPLE